MDYTKNRDKIEEYMRSHLTDKRMQHTAGVRETAAHLCDLYGGDREKADIAAMLHDTFRGVAIEEVDRLIDVYGVDPALKGDANLAHGKLAAAAIQLELGISDPEIVNAVEFHTTGRRGMSTLEKIVYLADAIEPGRDFPGVEKIRQLAEQDLDKACAECIRHTIEFVTSQGKEIDSDSVEALEYLEERINNRIKNKGGTDLDSKEMALLAAKAIDAKRGRDIVILDISEKSGFADYLVIANGGSERQISALADEVDDAYAKEGIFPKNVEGKKESRWILMDYRDVIVNILTEDMRERYSIEKVWGDCESLPAEW